MTSNYDKHIFRQLEDVLKKCDNLSQEIIDLKQSHKKEIFELEVKHAKEVNTLNERIDKIENENNKLKEENKLLKNDNDRMKAILNKDSSNSSIPPSKDEKGKKRKLNLRKKTNKKAGGQKHHKGTTLTKKDVEGLIGKENVIEQTINHGNTEAKNCVTKYEIDTKTYVIVNKHKFFYDNKRELEIPKDFKSDVHYGEAFKTLTNIMIVEEVISLERIEQFIEIITDGLIKVSQGSIVNWLHEKSQKCKPYIKKIKISLKNASKIYTDLTETALKGKKAYVRNYSTENKNLTHRTGKACG